MIASLELPGGIKITFQKVADAIQKVVSERTLTERSEQPGETREEAEYLQQIQDPNLVLTGIRIEIERRARRLAEIVDVRSDIPLARLLRELNRAGAIPSDVYAGLADLVGLGNAAAHGETVESHAAEWARTSAPDIFRVLDGYIEAAEVTLGLSPRSRTIPR